MDINNLTGIIINKAIKVHTGLGPGLLESTYENCLAYELKKDGIEVRRQVELPLIYNEVHLEVGYRIDLLIENSVIVEIKSTEALTEVHKAQVLTYLRFSKCRVGLLINFNVTHLKNGLKRLISNDKWT